MSLRVLIVEDEPVVAEDLTQIAEAAGHEVLGAAARASDARSLAPLRPDLALVDLNLKDGPTGPHIAADLARNTGAIVILVTANIDQIPPNFCGAIGAVAKPFTTEAMERIIAFAHDLRQGGSPAPPACFIPAGQGLIWRMARAQAVITPEIPPHSRP